MTMLPRPLIARDMEFIEGVDIEILPMAKVLVRVERSISSASAPSFLLLLSPRRQLGLFEDDSSSQEGIYERSPLKGILRRCDPANKEWTGPGN